MTVTTTQMPAPEAVGQRAAQILDAMREHSGWERLSQQLYFATARPTDHADIIVYNDQLQRPTWEVRPHSSIHRI